MGSFCFSHAVHIRHMGGGGLSGLFLKLQYIVKAEIFRHLNLPISYEVNSKKKDWHKTN
jgi:hypothetical protein